MRTSIVIAVLAVLIGTANPALVPAGARSPGRVPHVALLVNDPTAPQTRAFWQGLGDLGYAQGRNIVVEDGSFGGVVDRLPVIAAELAALRPDVIAVIGAVETKAVLRATRSIPVVFAIVPDAVAAGLVTDAKHPGGHITGFTSFDSQEMHKKLELLKVAIPGLTRVAVLGDQAVPNALFKDAETAAPTLALQSLAIKLRNPAPDIDGAFTTAMREHAGALLVLQHPTTRIHRGEIADLALRDRLPTLWPRDWVDSGWKGLLASGTSLTDAARRMPVYVDKILKGANPGNLPVEAIARSRLIINLRIAREIGVTIPPDVLRRADQIIQ